MTQGLEVLFQMGWDGLRVVLAMLGASVVVAPIASLVVMGIIVWAVRAS